MQTIKSVCLLRLSAIGDVCHAIAMVSTLRAQNPDIQLTWVIGKIEYQLVKHIPNVEFIIFDKQQGMNAFTHLKQEVKGRHFDVLLAMQIALRANIAAFLIPAKRKIGFDWRRSKELHWLAINDSIESQTHPHVLDGFMGFAKALMCEKPETLAWDISIPEEDTLWFKAQSADWGQYVVINPAASKKERNWLPERYAQITDHLREKGFTVVITGGPSPLDRTITDDILQRTKGHCIDLVGKTSLIQLVRVLQGAKLVIAPDTGPAHMATMVNTPVIGLYAHSNPRRTGPYLSQHLCVSVYDEVIQEQQGKTWKNLKWGTRAKGSDLMSRISVNAVIEKIGTIIV